MNEKNNKKLFQKEQVKIIFHFDHPFKDLQKKILHHLFSFFPVYFLITKISILSKGFHNVVKRYPLTVTLKDDFISNRNISKIIRDYNVKGIVLYHFSTRELSSKKLSDSTIIFAFSNLLRKIDLKIQADIVDITFVELLNECSKISSFTLEGVVKPLNEDNENDSDSDILENMNGSIPEYIDSEVPNSRSIDFLKSFTVKINRVGYFKKSGDIIDQLISSMCGLEALVLCVTTLGNYLKVKKIKEGLYQNLSKISLVGISTEVLVISQKLRELDIRDVRIEKILIKRGKYELEKLTLFGDKFPSSFHFNEILMFCKKLKYLCLSTSFLAFSVKTLQMLSMNLNFEKLLLGSIPILKEKENSFVNLSVKEFELNFYHKIKDFLFLYKFIPKIETLKCSHINILDLSDKIVSKNLVNLEVGFSSIRNIKKPIGKVFTSLIKLNCLFKSDCFYFLEDFVFLSLMFPFIKEFKFVGQFPKLTLENVENIERILSEGKMQKIRNSSTSTAKQILDESKRIKKNSKRFKIIIPKFKKKEIETFSHPVMMKWKSLRDYTYNSNEKKNKKNTSFTVNDITQSRLRYQNIFWKEKPPLKEIKNPSILKEENPNILKKENMKLKKEKKRKTQKLDINEEVINIDFDTFGNIDSDDSTSSDDEDLDITTKRINIESSDEEDSEEEN